MIITRTPFRISFFGGGTDYPIWWKQHGGAVLAMTISHFCYIICSSRLPFLDYKYLISYSIYESVRDLDQIQHPSVREVLRYLDYKAGVDVRTVGELPARSGLGASSAFTVGMLNAVHSMRGETLSGMELAREAIHVEQNMIREHVGCQDQVLAACGGLNRIDFEPDGNISLSPVALPADQIVEFESRLMLVFTGSMRFASDIAKVQINSTDVLERELNEIKAMVDEGLTLLKGSDWRGFGRLLHEAWQLKRSLTPVISNGAIDAIYDAAREAGATGGKLIGAGGGGFLLLFVEPAAKPLVAERLKDLIQVEPRLEHEGSQVIFNAPHNKGGELGSYPSASSVSLDGNV